MAFLDESAFENACGKMMPVRRDMSTFIGDKYQCACGREHMFSAVQQVLAEGFNGKFLLVCPMDPLVLSLVKTKMKFGIIYQGLELLAGRRLADPDVGKKAVKRVLEPAISELEGEGCAVPVSYPAMVYVGALLQVITKESVRLQEIKDTLEYCLPGEQHRVLIAQAWQLVLGTPELIADMAAMIPIAEKDVRRGNAEYFLRLTRHTAASIERMFADGGDFDPRTDATPRDWFLKV